MDNHMVPTYIINHCYPRYGIASVGPPQRGAAEKQVRNDNKKYHNRLKNGQKPRKIHVFWRFIIDNSYWKWIKWLFIVSFLIKNGDFPVRYVNVYQRVAHRKSIHSVIKYWYPLVICYTLRTWNHGPLKSLIYWRVGHLQQIYPAW